MSIEPGWDSVAEIVAAKVADQLRENPPVVSPWLPPEEAARYLNLSLKGLEGLRAKGKGPRYHKVNYRIVRYHVRDLDAWLTAHAEEVRDD
jgi:hypothetical protein